MVVAWHFGHMAGPASYSTGPILPLLDEGHVGVSLFMALSGYLFAKLLSGKRLILSRFLWNRALRLAPLLIIVLTMEGMIQFAAGISVGDYLTRLAKGLILPTMPKGTWSIVVEMHFYLLLPVLLWTARHSKTALALVLAAAIALRSVLYFSNIELQLVAFYTIVGRIDQFVLGILAFHYAHLVTGRIAAVAAIALYLGYLAFDIAGGFSSPALAQTGLWIILPTLEGLALAPLIVWYDRHPITWSWLSRQLGRAGEYSYSVYLLHFFFFKAAGRLVNEKIMDITSFYAALPWVILFYLSMVGVGHFSFQYIEKPFLRFRRPYVRNNDEGSAIAPSETPADAPVRVTGFGAGGIQILTQTSDAV